MPGSVLITGAARRIGRAVAEAFAEAGWRVVLHCNQSRAEAEGLCRALPGPGGHRVVQADFRDAEAVAGLVPGLAAQGVALDCLVNNASSYSRRPLSMARTADFQEIYLVNFFSPFELMRSFASYGRGSIINITDQRTSYVDPVAGPYALAKKSLRDATEAAALAWAPRVRVNAVAPGIVLPPPGCPEGRMEALLPRIPLQKRSPEQDVASACLYLAEASSVTGQTLYVDGGLHLLGHSIETTNRNSHGSHQPHT